MHCHGQLQAHTKSIKESQRLIEHIEIEQEDPRIQEHIETQSHHRRQSRSSGSRTVGWKLVESFRPPHPRCIYRLEDPPIIINMPSIARPGRGSWQLQATRDIVSRNDPNFNQLHVRVPAFELTVRSVSRTWKYVALIAISVDGLWGCGYKDSVQ